jgi:predicted P-loop ATPase
MQENEKIIDKKIIDFINKLNLTYNNEKDILYVNGQEVNEYISRVIIAQIERQCNKEIDIKTIKQYLSDSGAFTIKDENEINELNDLFSLVDKDNNIAESDFKSFLKWKNEEAIWNVDKDGVKTSINKCIANIIGFIEYFPKTKGKIMFNNVRNQIEWNGRQLVDGDIHKVLNLINKYFINDFSNVRMVKDALDNVAFKNKFNPWVDYFNKLQYVDDGIDYIDYTIKNVLCCEEQEKYYSLYYETLKIFYLATMHRIYMKEKNQSVKFDTVTTICSRLGGSGKGTFFERLFDIEDNGNTYCYVVDSDSFNPASKDFLEASHQCVCLLLDELKMNRAVITAVKGYITKKTDKFRKAYGYVNEDHIRGFCIVAASNNDDILKDYTTDNERRWSIIKISNDSNNYKNVNKAFDSGFRDKLWAFIKHIYDTESFILYMTDDRLIKLEEDIQRDYKASNNADYNSIVNDFLEREYGFYTVGERIYIDSDYIVKQYKHGDSYDWCIRHNEEMNEKLKKSHEGNIILQPSDKMITKYGKIDRISKSQLYEILNKIGFEWTKPSLNAELRYSGKWNGLEKGKTTCRINGKVENAYWRINRWECDIKDLKNIKSQDIYDEIPF